MPNEMNPQEVALIDALYAEITESTTERSTCEYFCKIADLPELMERHHVRSGFRNTRCPYLHGINYEFVKIQLGQRLKEAAEINNMTLKIFCFDVPQRYSNCFKVSATFLVQATFERKDDSHETD